MADIWKCILVPVDGTGGETVIPKGYEPFAVQGEYIVCRRSEYEFGKLTPEATPRETSHGHH